MKVLFANKFFFRNGGSEVVMFAERDFIRRAGHEVIDFSMQDDRNCDSAFKEFFVESQSYRSNLGVLQKLKQAVKFVHSTEAVAKMSRLIERTRPDVVHCHNIYHQLTPSIIGAAKRLGVPVVLTLHDSKVVCPVYTRLRNGRPCSACLHGRFSNVLRHRCADCSIASSALLYAEAVVQRWLGSYEMVDSVIAPSRFMMDAVTQWRFPQGRVSVVHNGVDLEMFRGSGAEEGYLLYLGLFSSEKGLLTLGAAHAGTGLRLVVAGTGPLEGILRQRFPQLELVGHQSGQRLQYLIDHAGAIVVPSECYENCPMSVLEAMAYGKPVIASRMGGIPELVADGQTGRLFEPGNVAELRAGLMALASDRNRRRDLGQAARLRAEREFSLDRHNSQVIAILEAVAKRTK